MSDARASPKEQAAAQDPLELCVSHRDHGLAHDCMILLQHFFFSFLFLASFFILFPVAKYKFTQKKKKQNYPFFYVELTVWDFAGKDGSYLISSVGLSTWRRVFLPTMEIMMYMPLL